jgi:hypothetical protein
MHPGYNVLFPCSLIDIRFPHTRTQHRGICTTDNDDLVLSSRLTTLPRPHIRIRARLVTGDPLVISRLCAWRSPDGDLPVPTAHQGLKLASDQAQCDESSLSRQFFRSLSGIYLPRLLPPFLPSLFTRPLLLLPLPPRHPFPTMKEHEEKEKTKLAIRLVEPVVYLKDVDFSGRCQTHNELSSPSMVRGVLVLHLSKPTKICSIEIKLTAKSATHYPEGTFPVRRHYRIA